MREWSSQEEFFRKLFVADLEEIEYVHHPSDEVLRAYLSGYLSRQWRDPESLLSRMKGGSPGEWRHQEASAHLLTCGPCRERAHVLQAEMSEQHSLWKRLDQWLTLLRERLAPVPRPALATMAVEFVVIVGLVGLLFFQPTPLFTRSTTLGGAVTTASAIPERSLEMAGVLPLLAAQAMQTLKQDPNPQTRLAAAQSLEPYAGLQLVEPLVQVLDSEQYQPVRQVLVRVISSSFVRTKDQFTTASQMYERIRVRYAQDFQILFQLGFDLEGLGQEVLALHVGVQYPSYEVLCASRSDMTLGQLSSLAAQFGGVLVIDRSLSTGSFRLRLPVTLGAVRTLDQMKSQLGIVCGR